MSGNHKLILLVDDDEELLLQAVHLFSSAGYRVKAARNELECEACVEEEIPDLVLMDVSIPEIRGLQGPHVLWARPEPKSVPIILYSRQPEERIRPLMEEYGATHFIQKHCEPHTLIECVENLLSNSMPVQRRKCVQ